MVKGLLLYHLSVRVVQVPVIFTGHLQVVMSGRGISPLNGQEIQVVDTSCMV